jgi:hypothetical protein
MESRGSQILCLLLFTAVYIAMTSSSNSTCSDTSYSCKSSMTCCKAKNTSKVPYGCCPMHEAICCSDGVHCCPKNTTCYMPHTKNGTVTLCYHKRNDSAAADFLPVPVYLVDSFYDPVPHVARAIFSPMPISKHRCSL